MRRFLPALCCALLASPLAAQLLDGPVLLDRIAALVNDGIVLESELNDQLERVRLTLTEQGVQLPPDEILRSQVLESLIVKRVQIQRAGLIGLTISDADLNRALAEVAQRASIPLSELPRAMASQGIDYTAYREQVREEMVVEQLRMRDVGPRVSVTRDEVNASIERMKRDQTNEEYEVSHILISVAAEASEDDVAAAEKEAQDLYERLSSGEKFGPIAVAYSDAPGVLQTGGSLGFRKGSQLPTIFADRVPRMSPGEVSEPFRSRGGFHIIRLDNVRGAEKLLTVQRHARHILITSDAIVTEPEAERQARALRQRILDGEDFAELAKAESDDPSTAQNGGDLDWTTPGTFVPEFETVLGQLAPGEVSEVFRSPFGWHIVELLETRRYDSTDDALRNRAVAELRNRRFEEESQRWVRQLRDEAFVEIRIGDDASG